MSVADQSASPAASRRGYLTVRFAPQFLTRIGARVPKSRAVGEDITGILFGTADEDTVQVHAFRSFQYPEVSSAKLRTEDLDELVYRLVVAARTDPEIAALDLVGWYAIRNTGGLHQSDVDFHNRHFRRPTDVAMIVRPEQQKDLLLELYARSPDASLTGDEHRWGALRFPASAPLAGAVEATMRPKLVQQFHRSGAATIPANVAERSHPWKQRLQSTRRSLRLLLPLGKGGAEKQQSDAAPQRREPASRDEAGRERIGPLPPAPFRGAAAPPRVESQVVRAADRDTRGELRSLTESYTVQRIYAGEPPGLPALLAPPKRPSPWTSSIAIFLVVFVITAGATFALVFVHGFPPADGMPWFLRALLPSTALALKAQPEGDRVLLSWNRFNPVVRSARDAVLEIDDGAQRRIVRLDAAQVENGSVLYRPASGDVTFRLEIHGQQGATATESMRVLDGEHPPVDVTGSNAPPALPQSGTVVIETLPASHPSSVPAASASSEPAEPHANPAPETEHHSQSAQSINSTRSASTAPSSAQTATNPAPLPRASTAETETAQTPTPATSAEHTNDGAGGSEPVLQAQSQQPSPLPNVSADTAQQAPVPSPNETPRQTNGTPDRLSKGPGASNGNKGTPSAPTPLPATPVPGGIANPAGYVPPRPIHQVLPDLKIFGPEFVAAAQEIEVVVKVGKDGHVINARVVNGTRTTRGSLGAAAIAAAKRWVFEPATLRGIPIESEHTIVFQFHAPRR